MNYWHVETNTGVTLLLFLSSTSESHSALWGIMICLCGGVHMSCVELYLLEMAEKAEFTRALLRGTWHLPQASSILFLKEI